ncbi:MAG: tetratricopeptide repeat protein [bacterium]
MKVYPYSPMNYDYETLKATFTAREELLKNMLENIRSQSDASSLQHYLVVGPRGIGKTHFLRLLYFGIKEQDKDWLPLQFAEEEYGVTNLRKFCRRIILEISNELTASCEKPIQEALEKITLELEEEEDDRLATEKAICFLREFTKSKQKKLLLLVDNIDLILGSRFMDSISLKRLRSLLMDDNIILLIGASSSVFKELINYKQPLYHLFQRINLVELSQEDAVSFIRKWAERTGERRITDNFSAYESRINSIYHLTGGNPRLFLFLFQIFTLGELPEVHAAFESLLEEITPYFKAKMETLSPQQREVMDVLSKMDISASPSALAEKLKLKLNQVTAVINTLVDNGYLKQIEKGRKKGTFYYDVTEQLFRIWYQIRSSTKQEKRFECLLKFIDLWYSLDELKEQHRKLEWKCSRLMETGRDKEAEMVKMHLAYVQEVEGQKERTSKTEATTWVEEGEQLFDEERYDEAIICCDKAIAIDPQFAWAWNNKGVVLSRFCRYDEALICFNKALAIDPQDASAWFTKGRTLSRLGRDDETLICYDKALAIDPQDVSAWLTKGRTLSMLGRDDETLICFDKVIAIDPQNAYAWDGKGCVLGRLGRNDESLICLDKALAIDPQNACAWYNKGLTLYNLGRNDEALIFYDKAIAIDPQFAEVWFNKGVTLYNLGRNDEALNCYDKAIAIDLQNACAWHNKGLTLYNLGRNDEALICFDKAIAIDPQDAKAWFTKGMVLGMLGRNDESLICYDTALDIDPQNAKAWFTKGMVLSMLGRNDESLICFDNALRYILTKREDLLMVSKGVAEFYLSRLTQAITEGNIGTAKQLLDKIIKIKDTLEEHKVPEKEVGFNQLMMNFFVELLKKKQSAGVLELLEILDTSKISQYIGFLFPFKILAEYLQNKDEDILNRQRPEIKGIIKEVLSKIFS